MVDRSAYDEEDLDSVQNTPSHEMEAALNSGSGKTPAPPSSRNRAGDISSDEDDCIALEVNDAMPLSYAYFSYPTSAVPGRQVMEDVVPLASQRPAAPKVPRAPKRGNTQGTSSGAAPPAKKRKTTSSRRAIPTSTR
jgi:hypothetical protein